MQEHVLQEKLQVLCAGMLPLSIAGILPRRLSFCLAFACRWLPWRIRRRGPRITASAKDIAKVLRGASLSVLPDPSSYMLADIEKVISTYEDFLADLCAVTAPPTAPLLQSGFALVFKGVSKSDCRAFAGQVVKAVAECRARGRNSTSGKKLPSSIFRISQVLKGQEPQSTKRKSIASSRASSPPPTPKLPVSGGSRHQPEEQSAEGVWLARQSIAANSIRWLCAGSGASPLQPFCL